eukprot:TRINITY_DN27219_c0_g1_i1.p1 TRINITY_DN27219_c0_g1~~TRINITY_DN27219_c0_g1_i1.p1  ORF type:complete len:711 (+),score=310.36 TRINITY_DN27219_c0_g1_i1:65-2134(+)
MAEKKPKKPPVNDQMDCEMKDFIAAAASHFEHGMNLEQLHQKIADTNSKLLEEFDRFLGLAREGSQVSEAKGKEWKQRGADAFKAKNYDQAILCYTRALHDITDAKAQAVLITNRATCLFHVGLLAHALGDADRATKLDPSYKKAYYRRGHILIKLEATELGKLDVAFSEAEEGGGASPPDVAAAVADLRKDIIDAENHAVQQKAVKEDSLIKLDTVPASVTGVGRRYVAAKDIKAGTVVLQEDPYTAALRPEFLLTHCEWCLQHTPNLYPSSRLQASKAPYRGRGFYCSARCEQLAWENYGEVEAQHPFFLICPLDATTALRAVTRLHNASKAATKTAEDDAIMTSLEGHSIETERTLDLGGKESAVSMLAYHAGALGCVALRAKDGDKKGADGDGSISVPELWKYAEEMRVMMRRIITNSVGVSKLLKLNHASAGMHALEMKKVASAVYPHIALTNHACDPTACLNYVGGPHTAFRRARLRVTRDLLAGEEVTICYGPHKNKIHSVRNRRDLLQKQYNFLCTCSACMTESEDPIDDDKQELMIQASTYYQKGRTMMRQRRHGDAIPALDSSLKILLDKVFIGQHRTSFVVGKTHDSMAECFAAVGDFAKAIIHCEKSIECTKFVHGANELEVAHDYLKLSGLAAQCRDFDRAREALRASEVIFSYYYGDARMPEVEECRDAIAQLSK